MATTKLLVIGGTAFVGRAIIEEALERGFEVTMFNRGQTNPDLFPQVDKRLGDRDGGLDALGNDKWDLVIDSCGYTPNVVHQSVSLLENRVGWYSFISSLAVFNDFSVAGLNEESPLAQLPDPPSEDFLQMYGPLKVLCEEQVLSHFGGRSTISRAGLIVGPHDTTGRFTHWLNRAAEGGDVLAPGSPERTVQFIDVRDLAAWTIDSALNSIDGVFNVPGSDQPLCMKDFLEACSESTGGHPNYRWCDDDFLISEGLAPYFTPPMWTPLKGPMSGMGSVDCGRAHAAGLKTRPLADTLRDTYSWMCGQGAGLSPTVWSRDDERRILQHWSSKNTTK